MSITAAACAFLPSPAMAQWWNPLAPKTYDECILKNMKGVTSDSAADMITLSCLNTFGDSDKTSASAAYVNGECNFTWTGYSFQPLAQRSADQFKNYTVTYEKSMLFSVWIPKALADSWGEDMARVQREFRALVGPHTDSLVRQCDAMISEAGR